MIFFHEKSLYFALLLSFASMSVLTQMITKLDLEEVDQTFCFSGSIAISLFFILFQLLHISPAIFSYLLIFILFSITLITDNMGYILSWNLSQYSINYFNWHLASNNIPKDHVESMYLLYGMILCYGPLIIEWSIYTIKKHGINILQIYYKIGIGIIGILNTGLYILTNKKYDYVLCPPKVSTLCFSGLYFFFLIRFSNNTYLLFTIDQDFDKDKIEFALGIGLAALSKVISKYTDSFVILSLMNIVYTFCYIMSFWWNNHMEHIKQYCFYLLVIPAVEQIYNQMYDTSLNKLIPNFIIFCLAPLVRERLDLASIDINGFVNGVSTFMVFIILLYTKRIYQRSIDLQTLICNNIHNV